MLACLGVCVADTAFAASPLPQDAYIWEQRWTPALEDAIGTSGDLVHAWHVLAGSLDAAARLSVVPVDAAALRRSGRPIVMVIRIDGQIGAWDQTRIAGAVASLAQDWQRRLGSLAGIEIDHDCATSKLAGYTDFLTVLRGRLAGLPLSITALPVWLSSSSFDEVLAATDAVILQVHAVLNPRWGLFDADLARHWTMMLARRTKKPFWLALPTYGSRVTWRPDGTILSVESEMPKLAGGMESAELVASPRDVGGFAEAMIARMPAHLAGLVWFRLPTAADQRAWSLPTWRAVLAGKPLRPVLKLLLQPGAVPGLSTIWLVNAGDADADLPAAVSLPEHCALSDGANGYDLDSDGPLPMLRREQPGLIPVAHRHLVGWTRCLVTPEDIHVVP